MALKIYKCKINDKGHLLDENGKLVLVQIGCELFALEPVKTIRDSSHLAALLKRNVHNIQLLKEDD